jgi:alpha-amylase
MKNICLYFQVHQPFRLRDYSVFEISSSHDYFSDSRAEIEQKAKQYFLPANEFLLNLINKHKGKLRIAFGISGVCLELLTRYAPEVVRSFKELSKTGHVEFLGETYHHSLACLFSRQEFEKQTRMHMNAIRHVFDQEPKVFRNTELIHSNEIAKFAQDFGFAAVLSESAGAEEPNYLYSAKGAPKMKLLLRNTSLSDDIAVRFSQEEWDEHPLTPKKYSGWIGSAAGEIINIFVDYDEFTSHSKMKDEEKSPRRPDIYSFMDETISMLISMGHSFLTPSDAAQRLSPKKALDIPSPRSWKRHCKDTSPWLSNELQNNAARELYRIEESVIHTGDHSLINDWRKLSSSDNFYLMSTSNQNAASDIAHPNSSPYDTFISYMNILNDLNLRIEERLPQLDVIKGSDERQDRRIIQEQTRI